VAWRAAAQSPPTDARPGFQLGAVTYNVLKDYDLDTIIGMLEVAGFAGVELRTGHRHGVEPSLSQAERVKVRQRFERAKVRLVSFGTTCEFHSPDPAERRAQVELGKQFVDLAHDTGARGIKVRPNDFPDGVTHEVTIANIGGSLHELGDYSARKGIQVYLEIHGRRTDYPDVAAAIMKATGHPQVGLCWNSNPTDIIDGSVAQNFELVKPWIRHVHINELANDYPWRELFTLLRGSDYRGYTLCEAAESKEPERFLQWYKSLWTELNRNCT
jgi:sugar phosphate isomerase/epimerase